VEVIGQRLEARSLPWLRALPVVEVEERGLVVPADLCRHDRRVHSAAHQGDGEVPRRHAQTPRISEGQIALCICICMPHVQTVLQDPLGEGARVHRPEHRREENRRRLGQDAGLRISSLDHS
jgi:hypothetical protein